NAAPAASNSLVRDMRASPSLEFHDNAALPSTRNHRRRPGRRPARAGRSGPGSLHLTFSLDRTPTPARELGLKRENGAKPLRGRRCDRPELRTTRATAPGRRKEEVEWMKAY